MTNDKANKTILSGYYYIKPFIPRWLQIYARRWMVRLKRQNCGDVWPIDKNAGRAPDGWPGWPEGKRFALVLTHDVEKNAGQKKCRQLMELEKNMGFRSSFNFVPTDYPVDPELRRELEENGFEVGVHGWTHDGSLYKSREIFLDHARRINETLREWGAVGFRSPAMHHNLEWLRELDIAYDLSTFDTDPFEPQADGMGTIFPFLVEGDSGRAGYVELPYTLCQDFTLFVLMLEQDAEVWRRKLDWIAKNGGMALINVHPDYMSFGGERPGSEEYPADYYTDFLAYISERYEGQFWHVLPKEMAHFWGTAFCAEGDAS